MRASVNYSYCVLSTTIRLRNLRLTDRVHAAASYQAVPSLPLVFTWPDDGTAWESLLQTW